MSLAPRETPDIEAPGAENLGCFVNLSVDRAGCLDIGALKRAGLFEGSQCVITFNNDTFIATWDSDSQEIIVYTPDRFVDHIRTECVQQRIGKRRYFLCPWREKRCSRLYYSGSSFASRDALRLNYWTQTNGDGRYGWSARINRKLDRLNGINGYAKPAGRLRDRILKDLYYEAGFAFLPWGVRNEIEEFAQRSGLPSKHPDMPVETSSRAIPPDRRKPRKASNAEIVVALDACGGVIAYAAQRLGVSRQALYKRVNNTPQLREAQTHSEMAVLEYGKLALIQQIRVDNGRTARWWLTHYGDDRGYGRTITTTRGLSESELKSLIQDLTNPRGRRRRSKS